MQDKRKANGFLILQIIRKQKRCSKLEKGKGWVYYFFLEAGDGERVPFVRELGGKFWPSSYRRVSRWNSGDRVVV